MRGIIKNNKILKLIFLGSRGDHVILINFALHQLTDSSMFFNPFCWKILERMPIQVGYSKILQQSVYIPKYIQILKRSDSVSKTMTWFIFK